MKTLMELLDAYYEKFKDAFPTMCFQTDTDEELIHKIDRCIKEGRSAEELYKLDYNNEY